MLFYSGGRHRGCILPSQRLSATPNVLRQIDESDDSLVNMGVERNVYAEVLKWTDVATSCSKAANFGGLANSWMCRRRECDGDGILSPIALRPDLAVGLPFRFADSRSLIQDRDQAMTCYEYLPCKRYAVKRLDQKIRWIS